MQGSTRRATVSLAPILPAALRSWVEPFEPALDRLLIPADITDAFETARHLAKGAEFARSMLALLNIRFEWDERDVKRVPTSRALVVVANHPFGIAEGLVLTALLDQIRPDWRILANAMLSVVGELRSQMILVNPFETLAANQQNRAPLRQAVSWLAGGGLLAVFPGGEVASLDWKEQCVVDPPWKPTAARLALRARCPVVPIYFKGSNSIQFQLAGALNPMLRTLSLARELQNLRGKTVHLEIGNPVPHNVLAGYRDAAHATAYLRSRTYFLANRSEPFPSPNPAGSRQPGLEPSRAPGPGRQLAEEVAALPERCELAGNRDFSVYLAPAAEIPQVLREIGRCREIAFRYAGEGTGAATDLDAFDSYYEHLFLWSKADSRLAGAYRLAVTTDVLPRFGIRGLYTNTLFRFHPEFFERIGPAVELGRSFIMPEYQRNYASLLLLWKGITRVVQRRPEAPVLFGAVSISQEYQPASRSLIATYLSGHFSHELTRLVRPRRKFRNRSMRDGQIRRFATVAAGIEDISLSIADIENDAKGIPVLLRQYLKVGGRTLGFSLDASFSGVLDALLVADLRTAPSALIERCMGRLEAREFREHVVGRSQGVSAATT